MGLSPFPESNRQNLVKLACETRKFLLYIALYSSVFGKVGELVGEMKYGYADMINKLHWFDGLMCVQISVMHEAGGLSYYICLWIDQIAV